MDEMKEHMKSHLLSKRYKDIIFFFLFTCVGIILKRNSIISEGFEFNGLIIDEVSLKVMGYISFLIAMLFIATPFKNLCYYVFNVIEKYKYIEITDPLSHETPDECEIIIEDDMSWLVAKDKNYAKIVEMRCKNESCAKDMSLTMSEKNTFFSKKKYRCNNCGYKFTSSVNYIELANIYTRNYIYLPIDKNKIIINYEDFINVN
ncbi:MAG: hypothetical protein GX984_06115, partial [Erysipelothrix sp.]|nr:hypothetical protein [Erysipelothrix sp.]